MLKGIEKSKFKTTLHLLALRVDAKSVGSTVKKLNGHLLSRKKLKCVVMDPETPDGSIKRVLFDEKIKDIKTLPSEIHSFIEKFPVVEHSIELSYSYFSMDEVLSQILPKEIDIPSSFEIAGHVAHFNLREEQLPYKSIIGQVLLDKLPQIRTVVNKTSSIGTEFRTFPMEIIAGENDLNVQVRESNAIFKFNYAQVYWNSRLQHEHDRIAKMFKTTDIICDMMCGIGPFAIPLALKGCRVYANDLNPKSFQYLQENIHLNKVTDRIEAFNLDARAFIDHLFEQQIEFSQVLMNLPATALEFLDVFRAGRFDYWQGTLPTVHCYCFSSEEDPKQDVKRRAEEILGTTIQDKIRIVRDVAPNKVMLCVSFQIPTDWALSAKRQRV